MVIAVGTVGAIAPAAAQMPALSFRPDAGISSDPPPLAMPAPEPSQPAAPDEETASRPMRIDAVSVVGSTVYPASDLARDTEGLTGPAVPAGRIDAARQTILRRYRNDGYFLTTVSATVDAAAGLHFVITEGHITNVRLDGDIGPAQAQVRRFLMRLTERQPIDRATLDRYLLLAQDVPGISLRASLEPSGEEPGALTLVARVTRQAVSGLLTFDNRAYKQTGPLEGLAALDLNSFTTFGERTRLSLYHTFPNSENFGQASTEFYLGDSGLQIRLYGGAGPVNPSGGIQQQFGTESFTSVFGGQFTYPLIRARQQTLNASLMFDGIDSTINSHPMPGATEVMQSYDAVRALRFASEYAWTDHWAGVDRASVNLLAVRLSQGVPILGASNNPYSPTAARPGEQSGFTKMSFEANRTQTLAQLSATTSLAMAGLFAGQWSGSILPPVEQFYLGGARLARGYYLGQVTGDKALAATFELQINTGFEHALLGRQIAFGVQLYGFYDWGETWQNVSADPSTRLASVGGGARVKVTRYTEFDLEGLARLNRHPSGQTVNASGVYWRLLTSF